MTPSVPLKVDLPARGPQPVETARRELGSMVSLPLDSPAVDTSGLMHFDASEVSEIRAEQLVSHSFVMNLGEIGLESDEKSQPVLLDPQPQDGAERPLDAEDVVELAPPIREDNDDTIDPDVSGPIRAEEIADVQSAAEARHARRDAVDRMSTVLSSPVAAVAPPISDTTDERQAWSEGQSPASSASDEDALNPPTVAGGIEDPSGPFDGRDLVAMPTPLPTRKSDDMESTQAAKLAEMVSGFDLAQANTADADFAAYPTDHPDDEQAPIVTDAAPGSTMRDPRRDDDDDDEAREKTKDLAPANGRAVGEFDEQTPHSSLMEGSEPNDPAVEPRVSDVQSKFDPLRAARVSGEEFDALLDELRDSTDASRFDNEATESALDDKPGAKASRPPATDPKRRPPRLR
jgi:hypothetical protein